MKRLLQGIDVSNWQGSVDWADHADGGVAFAFAKATEGGDYRDKWFARNWNGMRESWLVCGAYHFARPKGDPVEHARFFLRTVEAAGGLRRGDLVALDLETNDGLRPAQVARYARRWCRHVERHGRVRPFVYTFPSFAQNGHCAGLSEYPLWIACPEKPRGLPLVPRPWQGWTIHQYAQKPVDRNVFHGSRQELTRLGHHPR
ncbi:glycoside hydrolase family 25 protein [Nonomuraea sp. NN258]|uniref:glycoside hydrolase family 25 protein n=1 Tax=Nonomuraea antri TaxID=2730852 RepID=UPI001569575D|nr:GH25 family lysozyme [Nonomuraea antri]NRQ32022.1 glycoside hydrolase family 25 protein [Nonomuraea antri]